MTKRISFNTKKLLLSMVLIIIPMIARTVVTQATEAITESPIMLQTGIVNYLHQLTAYKNTSVDIINRLIQNNLNVIIVFYESWCPPCNRMAPFFDEIAPQRTDIVFLKIKRELYRSIFDAYNLKTVPAILFFKNGSLHKIQPSSLTWQQLNKVITQIYG